MKPLTEKQILAIQLFCMLILLFLNFIVWHNGKGLDCNKCAIKFISTKKKPDSASNKPLQNYAVNITDLYEGLLEDYCIVEFNKIQGYILKQNVTGIK